MKTRTSSPSKMSSGKTGSGGSGFSGGSVMSLGTSVLSFQLCQHQGCLYPDQGASHAAPGKSGLPARSEEERVVALE